MSYNAIDLFAGAGGFSLGFEQVGFKIELAIEKDAWASETYTFNHENKNIIEVDIKLLSDDYFNMYKNKIDVIMGGPPCQGFSIAASNRRKKDDDRNHLYKEFLRVIEVVSPKIVLMENVKEIIKYQLEDGTRIVDDISSKLYSLGYKLDFKIINSRYYGVPQDRKRFFLLAVQDGLLDANNDICIEKLLEKYLNEEISLNEAISDLPNVKSKQYKEDTVLNYIVDPLNDYQRQLRSNSCGIFNHIPMQHTEKTIEKFNYLLENRCKDLPRDLKPLVRGSSTEVSLAKYGQNHRILDARKVSPTITASFYSSFIHPSQPRNITVREAARIQTFPDNFVFKGKRTTLSKKLLAKKGIIEELHLDQFNQVGNAVPPIIANHFALICKEILRGEK